MCISKYETKVILLVAVLFILAAAVFIFYSSRLSKQVTSPVNTTSSTISTTVSPPSIISKPLSFNSIITEKVKEEPLATPLTSNYFISAYISFNVCDAENFQKIYYQNSSMFFKPINYSTLNKSLPVAQAVMISVFVRNASYCKSALQDYGNSSFLLLLARNLSIYAKPNASTYTYMNRTVVVYLFKNLDLNALNTIHANYIGTPPANMSVVLMSSQFKNYSINSIGIAFDKGLTSLVNMTKENENYSISMMLNLSNFSS